MPERDRTLEEQLERVTCGEYTYVADDDWTHQAALWGPDLVDVNDPDGLTIGGSLHLDRELVTDRQADEPADIDEALRAAVTLTIAHQLHEIAEWIRIDNERVFACHVDEVAEFQLLARIARVAADELCDHHLRHKAQSSASSAANVDAHNDRSAAPSAAL